jgi:hypothetical protein
MLESRRHPADLRFQVELSFAGIARAAQWFIDGKGRDARQDALTEIYEEMGPAENGPLSEVLVQEITADSLSHVGVHAALRRASNPKAKGAPTLALSDVFELTMPEPVRERLQEESSVENPQFSFVTEAEIRQGKDRRERRIGSNALALIDAEDPANWQLPNLDPDLQELYLFLKCGGGLIDPDTNRAYPLETK